MNCKECNAEFQSEQNRGKNQLYCSHVCRQRAAIKRYKDRIINGHEAEKSNHEAIPSAIEGHSRGMDISPRLLASTTNGIGISSDNYILLLEKLYEAKSECNKAVLEAESLRKELSIKAAELSELEAELQDEEEQENEGFLGKLNGLFPTLVASYKQEPEATIGFIKASFQEIAGTIIGKNGNKTKG